MSPISEPEQRPEDLHVDVSYLQALAETQQRIVTCDQHRITLVTASGSTPLSLLEPPDCRICLDGDPCGLIKPCSCLGTLSYAHLACLERWVAENGRLCCELCGAPYRAHIAHQLTTAAATAAESKKQAVVVNRPLSRKSLMRIGVWVSRERAHTAAG